MCKLRRPFLVHLAALRVLLAHHAGVDETVKMHGKRNIIIPLISQTVGIPAVAQIEGIQQLQRRIHRLLAVFASRPLQPQIGQHNEEPPIVRRQIKPVDLQEPAVQIASFRLGERSPNALRSQAQRQANGRHLHKALIHMARIAPVFPVLRICAMTDAVHIYVPQRRIPSACGQRHQSP
ncbi:hypothetical protein D3C75_611380 [compost metagenome]